MIGSKKHSRAADVQRLAASRERLCALIEGFIAHISFDGETARPPSVRSTRFGLPFAHIKYTFRHAYKTPIFKFTLKEVILYLSAQLPGRPPAAF